MDPNSAKNPDQVKDTMKKAGDQINKAKDQADEAFGRAKDAANKAADKNRVNPYDPNSRPAPMPDDLD